MLEFGAEGWGLNCQFALPLVGVAVIRPCADFLVNVLFVPCGSIPFSDVHVAASMRSKTDVQKDLNVIRAR